MRALGPILLLAVLTLGVRVPAAADATPPLFPPGSAVLPAGQTMVQMVAETVEITIIAPIGSASEWPRTARADFEARFTLRNQGEAAEHMDVRFPLAEPDALEPITGFAAFIDGRGVPARETVEPFVSPFFGDWQWAVFPVRFEPGVDVQVTVTYSTIISGFGWEYRHDDLASDAVEGAFFNPMNPDTAEVYYTLETGAAWYGSIESGTFVLRLPYEANWANVFGASSTSLSGTASFLSEPTFMDNEARWEFTNLEPTWQDNLRITFLWPDEWRRILDLQAEVERNPEDPMAAIELAGAYLAAGANWWEGGALDVHCTLSQQEIQRALTYNPSAAELLEALDIIASWCGNVPAPPGLATATPVPTLVPTLAYPRPPTLDIFASPTPAPVADVIATSEIEQQAIPDGPPSESTAASFPVLALIGSGVGIAVAILALWVVASWSKRRKR